MAAELRDRYWAGGRKQRGQLLDAFVLASGYSRKHAISVLRGRQRRVGRRRPPRRRRYGSDFSRALGVAWEASGYICAERLQPFLAELLPLLEGHGQLHLTAETRAGLLAASRSTVERNLHVLRRGVVGRRMSQTKPGGLLRRQIPVIAQWKRVADDRPGFIEIDLVSHSGEVAVGHFLWTLSVVDISTGWSERVPIMGKGQIGVVRALDRIRRQLPFQLRGIHPDTGSEFINYHLLKYCGEHEIAFARSRPYHKNDNPHVEQKNWTLVRRLIGYQRLDTSLQQDWLDSFYLELLRPYANCFQPVMKLVGKAQVGARTRRLYDVPKTPLRRLLDHHPADADLNKLADLVQIYTAISPLTLKRRIDRRLAAMPASLGGRASA